MKQLIDERDELIRQAELFRDYQLHCATLLYEAEKAGAQEEYNVSRRNNLSKPNMKTKGLVDLGFSASEFAHVSLTGNDRG